MKRLWIVLILISCLLSLFNCGSRQTSYNFGGSTTVLPIFESAIEEFEKSYEGITISYEGQGSSVGINGVLEETYTIGGSSRDLKPAEIEKGAVGHPVALDGLAVVVNKNVPLENIDLDTIAAIFSGAITEWSEIGGPAEKIVIINRDEASGTRAAFKELVLEEALGKDKGVFTMDAIITESNGDMVTKAGTTPNAIGYCGFGFIEEARNAGAKVVSVAGTEPQVKNVLDGSYPVSRKLYVVTKGELKEDSIEQEFLYFLLSSEGQAIVKDEGFMPLP